MQVAAYIRVSTDKQADKGYSLPEQEERIRAYCKSKDWELSKIYSDAGFTGSNMDRPALQELMREISAYDIVLVNKLDRLSRSQKDTLYLIQDIFAPAGASFVSMQESFDTTTPIGIAMVGILSAFAQLERSQIKERMKMGKEGRKKKGLWHGGVNIPTGYDYKDGILLPNDEAEQVRIIYEMFLEGVSIRDITRYLQSHFTTRYTSWNYVGTVRRILSNPVYIGMVGDYKGQHEPLIDLETFDRVQVLLDERKQGGKAPTGKHLMTGFIYCGYCGSRVRSCCSVTKAKRYGYYRCGRADTGQLSKLDHKCELKPKSENEIDEIIKNEILKVKFEDVEISDSAATALPDNSEEIKKIDQQINRLIDLYAICGDNVEELAKKLKDLKAKKKALEKISAKPKRATKKHIMESLRIAQDTFDSGSIEDKRMIVDSLISRVDLYNDTVKITWKFS
jgi:site-specific DNA recombinase